MLAIAFLELARFTASMDRLFFSEIRAISCLNFVYTVHVLSVYEHVPRVLFTFSWMILKGFRSFDETLLLGVFPRSVHHSVNRSVFVIQTDAGASSNVFRDFLFRRGGTEDYEVRMEISVKTE